MTATVGTEEDALVGADPVLTALAQAQAALMEAAAHPCWSLSDEEVVGALEAALAVRSGTETVTACLVGQAEARGIRSKQPQQSPVCLMTYRTPHRAQT